LVVAAVDDTGHAQSAVRWAGAEALLRGADLQIVHVEPGSSTPGEQETARRLVAATAAIARRSPTAAATDIRATRLKGVTGDELVRLSNDADLIVLGVNRGRPRSRYGMLGPLEDRVAVRAACPVVLVPPTSDPDPGLRRVAVSWRSGPAATLSVLAAFAEADLRGATVEVVAAGTVEGLDMVLDAVPTSFPSVARVVVRQLSGDLDVDTHTAALVVAGTGADLLVIGCHHSAARWSIRVGVLAEAVLRRTPCPVMLVGEPSPTDQQDRRAPNADGR
jgi:nucleotide-binding universal stress UspA family protein